MTLTFVRGVTLFLACYETTMSFIGNATLALLRNPMS